MPESRSCTYAKHLKFGSFGSGNELYTGVRQYDGGRVSSARLLTRKLRLAFLAKRPHAFKAVFGNDSAIVGFDFNRKPGAQIDIQPAAYRGLGLPQ